MIIFMNRIVEIENPVFGIFFAERNDTLIMNSKNNNECNLIH